MAIALKKGFQSAKAQAFALFLLLTAGAWFFRGWVIDSTVHGAVHSLRALSRSLPHGEPSFENEEGDRIFPLWPLRPGQELTSPEEVKHVGGRLSGEAKGARHIVATKLPPFEDRPTPQSVVASEQTVLRWAEQQTIPLGISRPSSDGMPAGIELYGVGALGIGLVDGDRLVSVDGRSVERRGQVIGAVLAARADERPSMRAGLVRHTKDGPVAFTVEVAQPYPESSAQPSPGVDDAEGVELEPALPEVTKSAPQ